MSILIFVVVLAVLIFVHELGHFLVAKWSGIRVDEFGIGFPPKVLSYKPKNSETTYSINWIPFGGFVKIFLEEPGELTDEDNKDIERGLISKPKMIQIWTLAAGVIFNVLFAWVLLSGGFISGMSMSVSEDTVGLQDDPHLVVVAVIPNSPAEEVGIIVGDTVTKITAPNGKEAVEGITPDIFSEIVNEGGGDKVVVEALRGTDEEITFLVVPQEGIIEDGLAVGLMLDTIGTVRLPPLLAVWEGAKLTTFLTKAVAVGLGIFISDAVTGNADFSQVAGPVGIVSLVGDASALGFVYLMTFTAFISINLAIINLAPFPALDGGRILFVIIEALKGSPINPRVSKTLNTIGFALLILLMIVVTYNDIVKLVSG